MTKNKLFKGLIGLAMLAAVIAPAAVSAANIQSNDILDPRIGTALGSGTQDVRVTIATIVKSAMSLLGIVAVLIILYGGFKWMTSQGSEEGVGEAKKIIIAGIIGLVIILMAYAIASFVISNLVTATTQTG